MVRIPLSLCVADGAECVGGAGISRSLGVADSGEACEGFGCGGAAADALTHAGGGELRRAWKLVGLAVLSGGHAVSWVYVCGQAQIRFPALVADEAAFGVLGEASVHTGADGLADAGCGLVGVLSARPLVMLEAEPV